MLRNIFFIFLFLALAFNCLFASENDTKKFTDPIILESNRLEYPDNLRQVGIEGTVLISTEIMADGTVANCKILKSLMCGKDGLDEYTLSNIKKWKFAPFLHNDQPVDVITTLSVNYKKSEKRASVQFCSPDTISLKAESGDFDVSPVRLKTIQPQYPEISKKYGLQGRVILEIEILDNGDIGEVEVRKSVHSGHGGLDEAAVTAVKQWKFKPAQRKGKPVSCWVAFPVDFKLD